jgi:hypothetical protein
MRKRHEAEVLLVVRCPGPVGEIALKKALALQAVSLGVRFVPLQARAKKL